MARPYLMVAPTGARRSRQDHPALPIETGDIVQTARACFAAGADGLHLHVRDAAGAHSLDAGRYGEALSELARVVPDMRVQITTESAGMFDVPAQLDCLQQVRPDWASVCVRDIARSPELADRIYGICADQGTEVQHILFDPADALQLTKWRDEGVVRPAQSSVIFVLGRYDHGPASSPEALEGFRQTLHFGNEWMVCAFGPGEHQCLQAAALCGGQVRVGFENSLHRADQTVWADNAESVAALRALLERVSP